LLFAINLITKRVLSMNSDRIVAKKSFAWLAGVVALIAMSLCIARCASAEEAASDPTAGVLDIFPTSPIDDPDGTTKFSDVYSPTGSRWAKGIDESAVFMVSLAHKADASRSWVLGIGKGGHVYSLRGAFGESVPPQTIDSRWNDEVWQFVATSTDEIEPIHDFERAQNDFTHFRQMEYFIHQSGTYSRLDPTRGSFYSPCLRSRYDRKRRAFETVNWIQQANAPAVWSSGLLVYTQYRDIGRGAIEVTYVVHNFGSETLEYLNTPWGGVRKSSLPHTIMSSKNGAWEEVFGKWGWDEIASRPLRDTAGWCAWTVDPKDDNGPTLGLVFGRDDQPAENAPETWQRRPRTVRWGTANEPERDYQATEVVLESNFGSGQTLFVRYYFVVGTFAATRDLADTLAPHAVVGLLATGPGPIEVETAHVASTSDGRMTIEVGPGLHDEPVFHFLARPYRDAKPIFLLEDTLSHRMVLSSDPYSLSSSRPFLNPLPAGHKEYEKYNDRRLMTPGDGRTKFVNLLGYAVPSALAELTGVEWTTIGSAIADMCPSIAVDSSCAKLMLPK
jgi:hypothetical protein